MLLPTTWLKTHTGQGKLENDPVKKGLGEKC